MRDFGIVDVLSDDICGMDVLLEVMCNVVSVASSFVSGSSLSGTHVAVECIRFVQLQPRLLAFGQVHMLALDDGVCQEINNELASRCDAALLCSQSATCFPHTVERSDLQSTENARRLHVA